MIDTITERCLSYVDMMSLEQRYRAAFVNSLTGFKSVSLIGTVDKAGQSNLAIFNSVLHIGANPPYIGFISRPDSVDRHTLDNIMQTGFYTINQINENIYRQAHQTAARYPKSVSEFEATGLTEEYKDDFKAPFVKESIVKMGVRFQERLDIKINNTVMIIGLIEKVYFPNNCLCTDGFVDIEKAGTITCAGLDSYHKTQRLDRLTYAKPDVMSTSKELRFIE